ncbi:MAG: hypothetical protein AAGF12_22155 [Myxococcota bacterium]
MSKKHVTRSIKLLLTPEALRRPSRVVALLESRLESQLTVPREYQRLEGHSIRWTGAKVRKRVELRIEQKIDRAVKRLFSGRGYGKTGARAEVVETGALPELELAFPTLDEVLAYVHNAAVLQLRGRPWAGFATTIDRKAALLIYRTVDGRPTRVGGMKLLLFGGGYVNMASFPVEKLLRVDWTKLEDYVETRLRRYEAAYQGSEKAKRRQRLRRARDRAKHARDQLAAASDTNDAYEVIPGGKAPPVLALPRKWGLPNSLPLERLELFFDAVNVDRGEGKAAGTGGASSGRGGGDEEVDPCPPIAGEPRLSEVMGGGPLIKEMRAIAADLGVRTCDYAFAFCREAFRSLGALALTEAGNSKARVEFSQVGYGGNFGFAQVDFGSPDKSIARLQEIASFAASIARLYRDAERILTRPANLELWTERYQEAKVRARVVEDGARKGLAALYKVTCQAVYLAILKTSEEGIAKRLANQRYLETVARSPVQKSRGTAGSRGVSRSPPLRFSGSRDKPLGM